MKKLTLLAITALTISLASCKKNYTCNCTTFSTVPETTSSSNYHETKSKAKDDCTSKNTTTAGATTVCNID